MTKQVALDKFKEESLTPKDKNYWLRGKYMTSSVNDEKVTITFSDKQTFTCSREDYKEFISMVQ